MLHAQGMNVFVQDDARRELLQMTEGQLEDVARVCNRYPDIQLAYEIAGAGKEPVPANSSVAIQVDLQREQAGDLRPVDAPRYLCPGPSRPLLHTSPLLQFLLL